MQRKALYLSLGLALLFAALPGAAAFSFAGAGGRDDAVRAPAAETHSNDAPLALDLSKDDCPFKSGVDGTAF